jgi:hypothetical protein
MESASLLTFLFEDEEYQNCLVMASDIGEALQKYHTFKGGEDGGFSAHDIFMSDYRDVVNAIFVGGVPESETDLIGSCETYPVEVHSMWILTAVGQPDWAELYNRLSLEMDPTGPHNVDTVLIISKESGPPIVPSGFMLESYEPQESDKVYSFLVL